MENKRISAVALIVTGLVGVNFFYLSDLFFPRTDAAGIVIGWKSGIAIAAANLLTLAGAWHVTHSRRED